MRRYKHTFERITFDNRWRRKIWNREDNWLIFGCYLKWFGHLEYEYQIGLFGLRLRIWFKREFIETTKAPEQTEQPDTPEPPTDSDT